jgi:peptide chain release factor subunit 1
MEVGMLSRSELERLAALKSDDGILSVYIKVDPNLGYDRTQASAAFKGATKRFLRTADDRARQIFEREKDRVQKHLDAWVPKGRSLVIFTSTPADLWEVLNLDVALPTALIANRTTYTAMLARLLDEYPRMAVALLDGEEARIYLGEQRQREKDTEITSDIPGWHEQGGWAQARYQRHIEFHHARHLKKVATELKDIYYSKPFDRLVIVGVDSAADELRGMLPGPIAARVIGHFGADFKQHSDEEILQRAGDLRTDALRREEIALVQQIADSAGAGGKGVVGLEDTIRAIHDGRVEVLARVAGITADGSACENCEYFSSEPFETCPVCSGASEHLEDVAGYAAEQAFLKGAKINTVLDEASEMLAARGGLGAVLRY